MKKGLTKLLALALVAALSLGLCGGAFAADGAPGSFSLETVCTDDGQFVCKVIVELDEPLAEADAAKAAELFEISVSNYVRNFYGFIEFTADEVFARKIDSAEVSEDGKTVTLNLPIASDNEDELAAYKESLVYKSDFSLFGGEYTVKLNGVELENSGVVADPLADKWGAVDLTETEYNYRFFDPSADYDKPEAGYPLVVWLHGAGESGTDNNLQITANRVTAWGEAETQDIFGGAYILAPQMDSAKNPTGWGWYPDAVMATIEAFIEMVGEENVDRNKITIGGCSMGGMGTWATIKANPDYFAAAFPICGATSLSGEDLIALKELPIYLIHSVDDTTVNVTGTLNAYDALTGAGKTNVYLALYEHVWYDMLAEDAVGMGHFSWIYVHNDFDGEKDGDKYFLDSYTHNFGTEEEPNEKTYTNTKPSDLGCDTFKTWLAAQSKGDVQYIIGRETVAFGEVVTSVTITGLDYIKATTKIDDYLTDNKFEIIVTDAQIGQDEEGNAIIGEFTRTPASVEVGEGRTSLIFRFAVGNFAFDPDNAATHSYKVLMNGEEVDYGGYTADTLKFESLTYTVPEYSFRGTPKTTMDARAYTPDKETYPAGENGYPLVIWLHGGGEIGVDNRIHLSANDVPNWTETETQDIFGGAYVLAPQNHSAAGDGAPAATMSVIEQFIEEKGDIDRGRIYVGGCSYGGIGTWQIIRNYPDYFAAAFPICCGPSGGLTADEAAALADLPIYMTVSSGDSSGIVSGMIQAYNDLTDAGSDSVYIAMFEHSWFDGYEPFVAAIGPVLDHWSWVYVHNDYDAEGEDYDGVQFLDTSKDGEYNDGKVVVKDGVLTYTYTTGEGDAAVENSITLNGKTTKPAETGYETFKTWLAAQYTENHDSFPFVDVAKEGEAYEAIRTLWEAGLTTGTSSNTYEPDATLTRAEFMTFLARATGAETDGTTSAFSDVLTDYWYTGAIAWGVEKGLIEGYGDGRFGPDDELTREQVNLIVGRLLAEPTEEQLLPDGDAAPATRAEVASVVCAIAASTPNPAE